MKIILIIFFIFFIFPVNANVWCENFVFGSKFPTFKNKKFLEKSKILCYSDFVILYSGITHGPLWSAEHLTKNNIENKKKNVRKDIFFEDCRISKEFNVKLVDYKNSGYDRGHMSPVGDRCNLLEIDQSFSLANIVPQNKKNNQILWSRIENIIRMLCSKYDDLFVITGPIFSRRNIRTIGIDNIFIPTKLFKIIYIPFKKISFAIIVNNKNKSNILLESINKFEKEYKICFPGIPSKVKNFDIKNIKNIENIFYM